MQRLRARLLNPAAGDDEDDIDLIARQQTAAREAAGETQPTIPAPPPL